MKLIYMLSVGVATVGMTCLVGSASAANTAPGGAIPDSMLVAQSTSAPGGKGGGAIGEPGRADKGTTNEMKVERGNNGLTKPGMGTDRTSPEKAKPGTEKTQPGGNSGSSSGSTGASSGSSGSSTEPTGDAGLSGMKGIGSGSSSGTGGGGK